MANNISFGGGNGGGGSSTLSGLSDVTLSSPTNGQVLKYDGSKWVNGAGGGSTHNYSTTEQVVGTWIDGSTLYEKTIQFPSSIKLTQNTWTDVVDVSALSINNLVSTTAQAPTSLSTMSPYAQIANGMLQAFLPFTWYISLVIIRYTKSST